VKFMPFALLTALFAAPAVAATMEQVAAASGQLAGSYNRAEFLCKAGGVPMPSSYELNKEFAVTALDLHNRYPEFFKHGFEKGYDQANRMLEDPRDLASGCAGFKQRMGTKKK
jgi:hypothetical protein